MHFEGKPPNLMTVNYSRYMVQRNPVWLINPLTHIGPLTDPKTKLARKLALYACLCMNGCNMKTKRPTEKL